MRTGSVVIRVALLMVVTTLCLSGANANDCLLGADDSSTGRCWKYWPEPLRLSYMVGYAEGYIMGSAAMTTASRVHNARKQKPQFEATPEAAYFIHIATCMSKMTDGKMLRS